MKFLCVNTHGNPIFLKEFNKFKNVFSLSSSNLNDILDESTVKIVDDYCGKKNRRNSCRM